MCTVMRDQMDDFSTVQDLLRWNQNNENVNPLLEATPTSKAAAFAREILKTHDSAIALETVKFLLSSLVSYHKKVVDLKREQGADDVYVWAYDYAQLNSALTIVHGVEAEIS